MKKNEGRKSRDTPPLSATKFVVGNLFYQNYCVANDLMDGSLKQEKENDEKKFFEQVKHGLRLHSFPYKKWTHSSAY